MQVFTHFSLRKCVLYVTFCSLFVQYPAFCYLGDGKMRGLGQSVKSVVKDKSHLRNLRDLRDKRLSVSIREIDLRSSSVTTRQIASTLALPSLLHRFVVKDKSYLLNLRDLRDKNPHHRFTSLPSGSSPQWMRRRSRRMASLRVASDLAVRCRRCSGVSLAKRRRARSARLMSSRLSSEQF